MDSLDFDDRMDKMSLRLDAANEHIESLEDQIKGAAMIAEAWVDGEPAKGHVLELAARLLILLNLKKKQ